MPMRLLNITLFLGLVLIHSRIIAQEANPFPPATPESVHFPPAAAKAIRDEVEGYWKSGTIIGGELLIIKNRKTVLHEAFGDRDREDKKPMEKNTIFNIRSMTKSLTGAAMQMLIDEGKVGLDDHAAKYLPGFDNDKSRSITVKQLLEHRSGLPLSIVTTKIDQFPDLQTQANAAGEKGPQFKPGEKFWYSDAGSDCVAAIVEKVSGMKVDLFITERILKPLGMADSFYPTKADDLRKARLASLYFGTPGSWSRLWKPGGNPMYPFAWGSQTLYSTPVDYSRYLAMWMDGGKAGGKQILSKEAMKRILTPVSFMKTLGADADFPTGFVGMKALYGQMSVLHGTGDMPEKAKIVVFGHSGSDGTIGWCFPEQDLIICYFTQSRGQATPIRLESILDREILHAGQPVAPLPVEWKPYLGTYYGNFGHYKNAPFRVLSQNGHLALDIPDQLVYELKEPDKEGRWAFAISDKVTVGFKKDAEGKVVSMNLKQAGQTFELTTTPARADPLKKEAVEKYLGKYEGVEDKLIVEVLFKDGSMRFFAPSVKNEVEVMPRADKKAWDVRGTPGVVVTFQEDKDGKVESFTLNLPDGKKIVRKRLEK
ncbi:MAG: serine hydrolase domain-containing protein [Gemmatales bacterium]